MHCDRQPDRSARRLWHVFFTSSSSRHVTMGNSASEIRDTMQVQPIIELTFPEMLSESSILNDDQISDLYMSMPAKLQSQPWRLTYSTDRHGYSFTTMYRRMAVVDGPVLVVVKDFQGGVFGVVTSDPIVVRPSWYGRTESFLYSFKPDLRTYGPTFLNDNCIFASPGYLMFGGSRNGQPGLLLNDEFCDGSSAMCDTYANKPLSKSEDFLIRSVEMWTFYDQW